MSASEKLKALDDELTSDEPFEILREELAQDALVRALPQIVAVVEAAEARESGRTTLIPLRAALTALEEALS